MTNPTTLLPGARRYLRGFRRELVRIAGIADAQARAVAFRKFWRTNCLGWDAFDPRLNVPRSLRAGYASPRVRVEPVYSVAGKAAA